MGIKVMKRFAQNIQDLKPIWIMRIRHWLWGHTRKGVIPTLWWMITGKWLMGSSIQRRELGIFGRLYVLIWPFVNKIQWHYAKMIDK